MWRYYWWYIIVSILLILSLKSKKSVSTNFYKRYDYIKKVLFLILLFVYRYCDDLIMSCFLQINLKVHSQVWVKSVRFRSYSGPHFPTFGINTESCGEIRSECRKIRNRITPNTDTFHAVLRSEITSDNRMFTPEKACNFIFSTETPSKYMTFFLKKATNQNHV